MALRPVRPFRNPFRMSVPAESMSGSMFTVSAKGANGANTISVTIQLKDARGINLTGVRILRVWLSDSATTGAISATGATTSFTVGGGIGSLLNTQVAAKMIEVITDATGKVRVDAADVGPKNLYLNFGTPTGVATSPVLAF